MQDSMRHRLVIRQALVRTRLRPTTTLLVGLLASASLFAQTQPATQPDKAPVSSAHSSSNRTSRTRSKPHAAEPSQVSPAAPVAPPPPNWPINDRPQPADITWNQQELRIGATNASLQQILDKVSTQTGSTIEGLTKDERVFGDFGPAPARDVLAQLLQGTGYNVLMVGGQGKEAPRQVILSARNNSKTSNSITRPVPDEEDDVNINDNQYDQPQQQQFPQPIRQGIGPDGAPMRIPPQLQQQQQQMPPQPGQPTPPNQ